MVIVPGFIPLSPLFIVSTKVMTEKQPVTSKNIECMGIDTGAAGVAFAAPTQVWLVWNDTPIKLADAVRCCTNNDNYQGGKCEQHVKLCGKYQTRGP